MPLTDMGVNERTVSVDYLHERLSYDSSKGLLRWKEWKDCPSRAWNKRFKGELVGGVRKDGYVGFALETKKYKVHRVVWAMVTGFWPQGEIDHINGNRSDNRFENLREATRADNARNKTLYKVNKSGYPGVTKINGRWVARICSTSLRKSVTYDTFKEAVEAKIFMELEAGFSFDRWDSKYGLSF